MSAVQVWYYLYTWWLVLSPQCNFKLYILVRMSILKYSAHFWFLTVSTDYKWVLSVHSGPYSFLARLDELLHYPLRFKSLYFLNHSMDLVRIWYNDRYRSEVYISNILPWPIGLKGKKLGHKVKSWKKTCVHLDSKVLMQSSWNFARMFISIKSKPGPKLGHFRSKTRS